MQGHTGEGGGVGEMRRKEKERGSTKGDAYLNF